MGLKKERRGEKFIGFSKSFILIFLKKKYCADVENCGSFKSFGFIYIYIDNNNNNNNWEKNYKNIHAMQGLNTTSSIPVCLSFILFWNVPKYCPVSKNRSH